MATHFKKGSWSLEEDQKLVSYINRYGIWNWSHMPRFAGLLRSGKSCRLRWMNYLKPNVKRGNFSKEEENIILHSHALLGNRWSAIASRLPGRTDNNVKNYWHSHLKKRVSEQDLSYGLVEKNIINSSPTYEAQNYEKLHKPANHENHVFDSHFTLDDSSSSCGTKTSMDHQVEFRTSSPGTIDDHQCFWDQLCQVENLDLDNNIQLDVFPDHVFQYSYNDQTDPYNYNDDCGVSMLPYTFVGGFN